MIMDKKKINWEFHTQHILHVDTAVQLVSHNTTKELLVFNVNLRDWSEEFLQDYTSK